MKALPYHQTAVSYRQSAVPYHQTAVSFRRHCPFVSGALPFRTQPLAALLAAAERWRGTPFQAHARICGAGVDCVQLAAALLEEAGLAAGLEFPPYTVDFGDHADSSPVLAWFRARPEWTAVPAEDIAPGDVVLFRVGRVVNHVGVALGDQRFCHCLRGHGVLISRLDDPTYARRFVNAYSPPGAD